MKSTQGHAPAARFGTNKYTINTILLVLSNMQKKNSLSLLRPDDDGGDDVRSACSVRQRQPPANLRGVPRPELLVLAPGPRAGGARPDHLGHIVVPRDEQDRDVLSRSKRLRLVLRCLAGTAQLRHRFCMCIYLYCVCFSLCNVFLLCHSQVFQPGCIYSKSVPAFAASTASPGSTGIMPSKRTVPSSLYVDLRCTKCEYAHFIIQ